VEGNAVILPGCYARLSVADNGAGMDAGTLAHIFEPFFTTKQKGKGTGLGLSIVRNMVTKHNGYISVISAPGVGTEFRVYLPLHAGEATQEQGENRLVINHNGTETVLVVEDDEAIMKLHKDVLGRYGYSVLAAVDGVEAMEVFNANIDEIRVAVVDVIMPRMNGRELVEQIRRQRPELPIIMISGYTDEIIDLAAIDDLRVVFMQKPVRPLDLMAAIQSSLRTNG
jgi:CheY-like chemotaxis protein